MRRFGRRVAFALFVVPTCLSVCAGCASNGSLPQQSASTETNEGASAAPSDVGVQTTNYEELWSATTTWLTSVATCMNDRGWEDTHVEDPDSPSVSLWDDRGNQPEAHDADLTDCQSLAGPEPIPPPLTEELAGERYDDRVAARNCLLDLGYVVSEPPSRETYVEQMLAVEPTWDPRMEALQSTTDAGSHSEVESNCQYQK